MFEVICTNEECEIVDFVNKFANNPIPVVCGTCGEMPEVTETEEVWEDPFRILAIQPEEVLE
jgi:hypothetical protein